MCVCLNIALAKGARTEWVLRLGLEGGREDVCGGRGGIQLLSKLFPCLSLM